MLIVFMKAEDSAAGLVKVATREKVYKCLAVAGKVKTRYISRMCMPEFYILNC